MKKQPLIILSILSLSLITACKESEDTTNEEEKCYITDFDIQENSAIDINCPLDLAGETITVPTDVTFQFDDGSISNGILSFSSTGKIDGELLNSELTIEGDEVELTSNTFYFYSSKWGIKEGSVSDDTARDNRDILEELFLTIKDLNADTFIIDEFDAYFKVDGLLSEAVPTNQGINLPSDFNLVMSDKTHIRMQPNGHFRASLLSIYDESNITITGGFLHGDREDHDYDSGYVDSDGSSGSTNEWVHTMVVKAGQNITIDGVTFMDATGDGINISGIGFYYADDHVRSNNVTIKNSSFYRARRTNIVITNGYDIYIDSNNIVDGGIDMDNSTGTAPSSNLNIEASRAYNSDGELIEYEKVNDVYITNNTQTLNDKEENSGAGQFQISHASGPVIIENNEMVNTGVSFYTAYGVEIRDNTFTEGGISAGSADNFGRVDDVYDNVVSGNTVITSGTAMNIAGNGVSVTDNYFEGTVAVALGAGAKTDDYGASNIELTSNTIVGTSRGITTNNTMNDVLIDSNTISLTDTASFAAYLINRWSEDYTDEANFVFSNNTITGQEEGSESGAPTIQLSGNSITFEDNSLGSLQISSSGNNLEILSNKIDAQKDKSGVTMSSDITNTTFDSNDVIVYTSLNSNVECKKVTINDSQELADTVTFNDESCTKK